MVATKENDVLRYVHQDHLTGTSLMTDSAGNQIGETMKYLPFGETLSGSLPTDKLFTGQRLDGTGLYYYGARYYDATIGRFTKPDTIVQSFKNPQTMNRYSYTLNNPLKYTDPSGKFSVAEIEGMGVNKNSVPELIYEMLRNSEVNDKLVVSYADGSEKEYSFKLNGSLDWNPGANTGLEDSSGTAVNITDILSDSNISEIRRWRPVNLGRLGWSSDPRIINGHIAAEFLSIELDKRFVSYGTDYVEMEALCEVNELASIIREIADIIRSLSPGFTSIPPEQLVAGAGFTGIGGFGAVALTAAFYYATTYGGDWLDSFADWLDENGWEDPQ